LPKLWTFTCQGVLRTVPQVGKNDKATSTPHQNKATYEATEQIVALFTRPEESEWVLKSQADVEEHFWSQVEHLNQPDSCWLWLGSITTKGYGIFTWRDPMSGICKRELAHRMAFAIFCSYLPKYLVHACGERRCVRPTHLFNGNPFKELTLTSATGHQMRRSSSHLTAEEALTIRVAAALGADEGELAFLYNVQKRYIARITLGRTFKYVGGPIREPRSQGVREYREQWLEQIRESVVQ
jgi:hypothetical protein